MKQARTERYLDGALNPWRWLRAWSVLLLAAFLLGPASGLDAALHHQLSHDFGDAPPTSEHDCAICLSAHAPLSTTPPAAAVVVETPVGVVHDQPCVDTGWLFVSPTSPRGPPIC